jgi:tagatose-1,6-bisphosphate aldolase
MAQQFKESVELIEGIAAITRACIQQFADGFQATDLPVLVAKLAADPKVTAAVQGVSGVKVEFSAMDAGKIADAVKELTPPMTDLVVGVIQDLQAKAAA